MCLIRLQVSQSLNLISNSFLTFTAPVSTLGSSSLSVQSRLSEEWPWSGITRLLSPLPSSALTRPMPRRWPSTTVMTTLNSCAPSAQTTCLSTASRCRDVSPFCSFLTLKAQVGSALWLQRLAQPSLVSPTHPTAASPGSPGGQSAAFFSSLAFSLFLDDKE